MFCNKQLSILHKKWKATKMSVSQFYQWVYHPGCINKVLNFDGCRLEYGLPKRLLTEWCYWENNGWMTKITEKKTSQHTFYRYLWSLRMTSFLYLSWPLVEVSWQTSSSPLSPFQDFWLALCQTLLLITADIKNNYAWQICSCVTNALMIIYLN